MQSGTGELWEVPYLPIDPLDIGREYTRVIRINSQSGKSGIAHVLERDSGYRVPRALAIEFGRLVQALTDERGTELASDEVARAFESTYLEPKGTLSLTSAGIERLSDGKACAVTAKIILNGQAHSVSGVGGGPIEAFVRALATVAQRGLEISDYSEHARGVGADAEAVAYVALQERGAGGVLRTSFGAGRDSDLVLASFRAIVAAFNRSVKEGVEVVQALA
jgi:2-isopropylmalate synthase